MRTSLMVIVGLVAVSPAQDRQTSPVSPCTTATAGCTGWVTIGSGPARSMIYRTHSLETRNERIRRALIMVHGTNRNADHYFSTAVAAAFLAGALHDSVVISPRIASAAGHCRDTVAANHVS